MPAVFSQSIHTKIHRENKYINTVVAGAVEFAEDPLGVVPLSSWPFRPAQANLVNPLSGTSGLALLLFLLGWEGGSALDVFPNSQGMLGSPRECFQELPRASFPARRSQEDSDIRLRRHRPRPDLGALGSGGSFDRLSGLTRVLSIRQPAGNVTRRLALLELQEFPLFLVVEIL